MNAFRRNVYKVRVGKMAINVYKKIVTDQQSSLTFLKVVKELYLDKWPSRLMADIDGNRMIVDLKGRLWPQDLADNLEID